MAELFLKTKNILEAFKLGESKNYEKDSVLIFNCSNCNSKNSIPLVGSSCMSINLQYPNKLGYSLERIREISKTFNLKEDFYPKTGIYSFKINTSDGYKQCFLELLKCDSCGVQYSFCMAYFGDYSRYPGAKIHLVGVNK